MELDTFPFAPYTQGPVSRFAVLLPWAVAPEPQSLEEAPAGPTSLLGLKHGSCSFTVSS